MNRVARTAVFVAVACLAAAALHAATLRDLDAALAEAAAYEVGQSRKPLTTAATVIRDLRNEPNMRPQIETRLLGLLQGKATVDARRWACRQLSIVASAKSVPPLASRLTDPDLAHMARWALERIPGDEAGAALRKALPTAKGELRIGLINSIACRGDAEALPALKALAGDQDAQTAAAAIAALGQIGGEQAAQILAKLREDAPAERQPIVTDAWLRCADQLVAAGKRDSAAAIYKQVYDEPGGEQFRTAAFRGLLATGDKSAWRLITQNLRSDDSQRRAAAARFAREIPGSEATTALAGALADLPPEAQRLLLGALAARGDPAALPAVRKAARHEAEGVRVAALQALGALGDASCIDLLAQAAASDAPPARAAASRSLASLRGEDVDEAMRRALAAAKPEVRAVLIDALGDRRATSAVPELIEAARADDKTVRRAALKALAELAPPQALPDLVDMLLAVDSSSTRRRVEKALAKTVGRVEKPEAAAAPLLAALPKAKGKAKASLITVLGKTGSSKALDALRRAVQDAEGDVQDAAVRALSQWPDPRPMAALLEIARGTESKVHRVLALRGFVAMAAMPGDRSAGETAELFGKALGLAERPQDKKMVLAALASVHHPDALALALSCVGEPALEAEAVAAALSIAKAVRKTHRKQAAAAIDQILKTAKLLASKQAAENARIVMGQAVNIAPQGAATSPDGLEKDGAASGDQAAIDGNPDTYWDEANGKKLYRLVVTFKEPERVDAVSVLGYQHHSFAPRDFDVLCDGKVVQKVRNAQYSDNLLVVRFQPVTCRTVELKITGYYSGSPAIRELGIYAPGGTLPKGKEK
ncbi:MAG: HEAT repeat domain-containing protein [Planctomycetota bacterium]